MLTRTKADTAAGIRNLFLNCAKTTQGQRVLLLTEAPTLGYFESGYCKQFVRVARALELQVDVLEVGFSPQQPKIPAEALSRVADYDIVVFLARLGDQLRFAELPNGPRFIACFANNDQFMGSAFGVADYRAFLALKTLVDQALIDADRIVVTCPAGTNMEGRIKDKSLPPSDTTSVRFPLSVFSPVMAESFSGRVALAGFLTGTGSRYYDGYSVEFEGQVFAHLAAGRLVRFSGGPADVAKADAHYDRIARLFDLDRNFVHSWHAGIHPGCGFPWDARENYEHWGCTAFGNPRILHFHTCGSFAPGEISWNLIDPTIEVDGIPVWQNGVFHAQVLPGGADVLAAYPEVAEVFANPDRRIGL